MVTAVPITARATPVSKIVAVANSVSPKIGMSKYPNVWVKKGTSKRKLPIPVKMAIKTPIAATFLKSNGIFFLMVSISKAKTKV